MRFGFFGLRGVNEFINENGDGFYFTITRGKMVYDSFFPNVGQPDQDPPKHFCHKDNPEINSEVELGKCSFDPFYAKYTLLGSNHFEWFEDEGKIFLKAEVADPICFYPVNGAGFCRDGFKFSDDFYVKGLRPGEYQTGEIKLLVSSEGLSRNGFPRNLKLRAKDCGSKIEDQPALASVFYNLSRTSGLKNRFYVPVNKTWPRFMANVFDLEDSKEGPLIFSWDGCFSSIILSRFDIDLAALNLLSVFEAQMEDGRIPQVRIGHHVSNRTNPPIWFLAAEEIFRKTGDLRFLVKIYPKLTANYHWFRKNRMRPDYTFSWGTDNEGNDKLLLLKGKVGAVLESGLDDTPLYDQTDIRGGRLDCACIDLSSLMARACEVLISFTEVLIQGGVEDLDNDLEELKEDFRFFRKAMRTFFCSKTGMVNSYIHKAGSREFLSEVTPLSFYPLLTSFLDQTEVKMLRDLYYSPHFKGRNLLPSLSYQSESYDGDGDYWRGRIWPPLIYLTAKGFEQYVPEIYQEIKAASEDLLWKEWNLHHHVHENYSAVTGRGEPQNGVYARSCPLYSWGGLLGIL